MSCTPGGGKPGPPGGLAPNQTTNRVLPTPNTVVSNAMNTGGGGGLAGAQQTSPPNPGNDLASLFECPVCFDYVLPPILQVTYSFSLESQLKTEQAW
jgi:hypothetical protein